MPELPSLAIMATLALFAAGAVAHPAAPAQRVAIANPATEHCVRIGGRSTIRKTKAGDVGYCLLRDGRRVEEWKLYRASERRASRRGKGAPDGS